MRQLRSRLRGLSPCRRLLLLALMLGSTVPALLFTMRSNPAPVFVAMSEPRQPLSRCLGGADAPVSPTQLDAACARPTPEPCRLARIDHLDLAGFSEARLRLPSFGAALKIFVYPPGDLISDSIRRRGSWEAAGVRFLTMALRAWPHSVLIDVGSSVGVYSLSAARVGRRVLAVDANYRNALRLAKSAQSNGLSNLVHVFWNAVSDQPAGASLGLRLPADCNLGGADVVLDDKSNDDIRPRAIGLDRLTASASDHLTGASAVFIKLDIEGQEWTALETGQKLFNTYRVPMVMMEWSGLATTRPDMAARLLQFFAERKFLPYTLARPTAENWADPIAPLSLQFWKAWPGEILWTRNATLLTDGWRVQ